ncbi:MAG: phosphopantetheine-binding protein [Candidatus Sericytochromatia bacterium]
MSKREDIEKNIIEIIENNLIDLNTVLDKNTNLKDNLNIDSMTLVRIILDINDYFNISIESNEINDNNFLTVKNIIEFVKGKI